MIGKAIRVDVPTAQRGRGKFARLCVELDLSKSLILEFSIEGKVQSIEYECMSLLCLHYGRYGHVREACVDFLRMQREKGKAEVVEKEVMKEGEELEEVRRESPWKVVQNPWRQRRGRVVYGNVKASNRFEVLNSDRSEPARRSPLTEITN